MNKFAVRLGNSSELQRRLGEGSSIFGQLSLTFQACRRPFGDISTLSSCSRTTLRLILLLLDNISTSPAAQGRHFDLSCCPGTAFRLCPAAPG